MPGNPCRRRRKPRYSKAYCELMRILDEACREAARWPKWVREGDGFLDPQWREANPRRQQQFSSHSHARSATTVGRAKENFQVPIRDILLNSFAITHEYFIY